MLDTVLFMEDMYDNYGNFENAKNEMAEIIMENAGYESPDEITDNDVFDEWDFQKNIMWDDIKEELICHDLKHRTGAGAYLVVAKIGRWDGVYAGGKIFETLEDVLNNTLSEDYIKLSIVDNELIMDEDHHDGHNTFTVKYITPKGLQWAENNYGYDMEKSQGCHEHLLRTKGHTRKMFSGNWKF